MRKPAFCICENNDADQLRGYHAGVTAQLISAFVFARQIVRSLYFLDLQFQASSHFLWLYSLVCVRQIGFLMKWLICCCVLKVYAVDWSPDGQKVVSGGKDKVLKM